jgi:hypothetical protein
MIDSFNLKNIEKKLWQLNFDDGITDITIALVLIVSTICQIFNEYRFGLYLLYILPVLFSIIAKNQITVPRIGFVKYSKERNNKRHLLTFTISTFIFVLLIFTITGKINIFQPATPLIIGTIILIICSVIAFVLNYKRLYLYGLLITSSFAVSELTIHRSGIISSGAFAWLISGLIILTIGIYYLFGFIKKYSKPNSGEIHGE